MREYSQGYTSRSGNHLHDTIGAPTHRNARAAAAFPECPYSIVWNHLGALTLFTLGSGHIGVTTSEGVVHDFAGSYYIRIGDPDFQYPQSIWRLKPEDMTQPTKWDAAIEEADALFRKRKHNYITNNCHHHVAHVLNAVEYKGFTSWTPLNIWWNILRNGKANTACGRQTCPVITDRTHHSPS